MTVNSASSVTLTNNNTYSGGTTISGGTLVAGAGALGTGAVNVGANGTLSVSLGPNIGLAGQYFSTVVSGGNPNQGNFNSLLALQQHIGNAYVAGNPNATPVLTAITPVLNLNNGGAGFPAGVGPNQFEGYYSGLMNVTQSGSYTFYLGSDDGTVLWIDGQLVVNDNHYQGFGYPQQQGSITLGAGEHNIVLGYFQGTGGFSFEAGVSGPGITGMVDLGTAAPRITPDLVIGSLTGSGNVQLTTGNLIVGTDNTSPAAFSGVISGIGGVLKVGSGTLTLSGVNTYSGDTTIASATVQVGNTLALQNSTVNLEVNNGLTFSSGLGMATLGGLAGSGNAALQDLSSSAVAVSVGNNNANTTYSGVLSGRQPDENRHRHANSEWQQHLHRRHHGQRRHAGAHL